MFELVGRILEREERIVDGDDGGIRVVESSSHDETTNASKAVDSEAGCHLEERLVVYFLRFQRKGREMCQVFAITL